MMLSNLNHWWYGGLEQKFWKEKYKPEFIKVISFNIMRSAPKKFVIELVMFIGFTSRTFFFLPWLPFFFEKSSIPSKRKLPCARIFTVY